jgi:hypothetical protein
MYKIEGTTIKLTRGDIASIGITAKNEDGTDYIFQIDDIVRFKVFEKKGCDCVKIQKDVEVSEETTIVKVFLDKDDTKIDEFINKPKEYWYEVELNPEIAPQTIIGYDDTGAKLFMLYPEGSDMNE